jgi:hypothetical protein
MNPLIVYLINSLYGDNAVFIIAGFCGGVVSPSRFFGVMEGILRMTRSPKQAWRPGQAASGYFPYRFRIR